MNKDNNTGWVKLYRSLLDWEWWSDRNTRDLFIYCIMSANHETTKWRGRTIERGQFITSVRKLADGSGLTERETRTALQHLISTHELTQETTHDFSIITIYNYEKYQGVENESDTPNDTYTDTPATHDRHTTDTHNNNDNNVEEDNNIPPYNPPAGEEKPKRTRKSFIKPTLEEVAAYCQERNNGINPQAFIDYYDSCGWMVGNKPMKDWKAAVRTWENKRKANNPQQPISVAEPHTEEKNGLTIPSELERAKAAFKF